MGRMTTNVVDSGFVVQLCAYDRSAGNGATVTERPVWSRIESALHLTFEKGGFVDLRVLTPGAGLVKQLTMNSIGGKYRLVALTRSADPKLDLLEWWEPEDRPFSGTERFGDDEWDARTVSSNISHALSLFQELFQSGDLSVELNGLRSRWNRKPR